MTFILSVIESDESRFVRESAKVRLKNILADDNPISGVV
jgi:hypothetical protein